MPSRRTLALGLFALGSCMPPPPRPNTVAISREVYVSELNLAREALQRSEWQAAREHLDGLVDALPPNDPIGLEARSGMAYVAFELGDYARALAVAAEVPSDTPHTARAIEYQGLAQLFSCDFEHATESFLKLSAVNRSRGRMWLGMAYAWMGASANAQQELQSVVSEFGSSEDALNARFYLAQLALWENRRGDARRHFGELPANYLSDLDGRATNWINVQHTHYMRAYFSFDTRARFDELTRNATAFTAHDRSAEQALAGLQQTPGACQAQVGRLAEARAAHARQRTQLLALARAQQEEWERQHADDDGDNVPNVRDRCPNEAETYNGINDGDGCPERDALIYMRYGSAQIEFARGVMVHFAVGQDTVLPDSQPIIEQLGAALQHFSAIRTIAVVGHTDNQGAADANLELSRRRAQRVALAIVNRWFAGRNISPDQIPTYVRHAGLGAQGAYGETEEARAHDRRVDITIVDPPMIAGTGGIWAAAN